jgi:predicted phage baseplate assembly protein
MTAAWWGKEASPTDRQQALPTASAPASWPQLVATTRDVVVSQLAGRITSYTPEWSNRRPDDAGIALLQLFSEEMEPVLQRLNQLPQNSFIQFLRIGGVAPLPATPAQALLQFAVSDSAAQSIAVPAGFQVSAGSGIIFETDADLSAAPGTLQELYALEHGFYRAIDPAQTKVPFMPFGKNPKPGLAFFIGILAAPTALIGPTISLGFEVQGPLGQAPPVSSGGLAPAPVPLAPALQWDVLDGATYREARVRTDETGGLSQSGVVTLELPSTWRPGIPAGAPDTAPLFWLRVQILYGSYPTPPLLSSVKLNLVRATAVQSFYNEVLMPVPGTSGDRAVMALSQTPVLPGSLVLQVDDTANISFTPVSASAGLTAMSGTAGATARPMIWTAVDDLDQSRPDDKVYELDPSSGQVTFGDGTHGAALPPGFRNVVALKYQVGGGSNGAVDAGQISSPVNSIPFISGVQNPWPATGGMDAETQDQALQRGPRELRAHGRAVAVADYEILALRAVGAQVARAGAVAGFHPSFPGTLIPGVVCIFVVPPERGQGPPSPDDDTLRAVCAHLSTRAPAGVEIVAAAPIYHTVRVEMSIVVNETVSRGAASEAVLTLLDTYLDPIEGGDDGQGWPFGGTLSNAALVRKILHEVAGVTAVPSLIFVVDGVRGARCADFPLSTNSLVWPTTHAILALGPGEEP